ncbi:hypothetical protein CEP52_016510 [Fusarium oligoseptatum]|uniref:T6SS Phospholipase effector Tle1-like catalytic domain-containing protein n=1 Tax=Fusarium oligoseptatum TaxID=2604345 RepID=A0A428S2V9_9HYPO|nr:hypothetical protein CEP52_016510 [Fusarium oligoseptatum]
MDHQTENQPPNTTGLLPGQVNLEHTEKRVLADVLDHSNDVVASIKGIHERRSWGDHEPNVTAKMFRDIAEDKGKKRLFVCCDGTWKNASGTSAPLTNVARFARSIDRFGLNLDYPASPIPQVIYYSGGVGSQSAFLPPVDSWYSGATGAGLEENILSAYCFLSNNYNFAASQDEIILVGYSRGAFTVRCLADFISQVGLLRRKTLPFLSALFKRWTEAKSPEQRSTMKTDIRKVDPNFSLPVKIKVLAEWDPVSAMGHTGLRKKFSFVNDAVPSAVEHAFLAVALDERRSSFMPLLWANPPTGIDVAQCAFSGCHGDIGGGNLDSGLSTVSLLWMVSKVERACKVAFDREALLQMVQPPRPNKSWWRIGETPTTNLAWSKGEINESLTWKWWAPHLLTFGWLSGRRRRYLRNTFPPPTAARPRNTTSEQAGTLETTQRQPETSEAVQQQPETSQTTQQQPRPAGSVQQNPKPAILSELFKTNHNNLQPPDDGGNQIAKILSGDVAEKIQHVIPNPEEANVAIITNATVQTAVHVHHNRDRGETRVTAAINAAFKTPPLAPTQTSMGGNPVPPPAPRNARPISGLKLHFTARRPGYRMKEGMIESLLAKISGPVDPGTPHFPDYLPEEPTDKYERRLWEEWENQVRLWDFNAQWTDPRGPHDVRFWTKVVTRFDNGDADLDRIRSAKVDFSVSMEQLWRVCRARDWYHKAMHPTVTNAHASPVQTMISSAFQVIRVAEMVENERGSGNTTIEPLESIWDAILDLEQTQEDHQSVTAGTVAQVVIKVAHMAASEGHHDWNRVAREVTTIIASPRAGNNDMNTAFEELGSLRRSLAARAQELAQARGLVEPEDLEAITQTNEVERIMREAITEAMKWALGEDEMNSSFVIRTPYPN